MSLVYILLVLVLLLYLKWILIVLLFPFQMVLAYMKRHRKYGKFYFLMASPYLLFEKICRGGWERYMLFQVSRIPSLHVRRFIYKALGVQVGKNVVFHVGTEIRYPTNLFVGEGSIIGDNAILDARCGLSIGKHVNISSNVSIYTLQHDHRDPSFECNLSNEQMHVEIGNRVWLGCNVIVLPGVKIGEGAVCCAGCVVTKDVEPYAVVAGIPAKKVNERPQPMTYEFDGYSCRLY